ncbi:MAG: hypothetical protein Q8Q17_02485 [bacterium]|nr:hypothetical protein [bacterium]
MKRGTAVIVLLLSMLGVNNAVMAQEKTQQALERAYTPVYQDGDWWEFKIQVIRNGHLLSSTMKYEGVYRLMFSRGWFSAFYPDGSQMPNNLIYIFTGIGSVGEWRKKYPIFNFPLFLGKKWTFQYRLSPVSSKTSTGSEMSALMNAEVKVTAIENIAVQAGVFSAFKIEREESGLWHRRYTYYYSPRTKSGLKFLIETAVDKGYGEGEVYEIELLNFGSASGSLTSLKPGD